MVVRLIKQVLGLFSPNSLSKERRDNHRDSLQQVDKLVKEQQKKRDLNRS
jgi:hypothetical protein